MFYRPSGSIQIHDPSREDKELLALEKHYRERFDGIEIEVAREGMEIDL
jgi:hypothetical protein